MDSDILPYVLPVLIFLSRVIDVSLGTLRIIFVNRGMKFLAPIIGFFEVLIWLLVIGQIMRNLNSPVNYIAYAAGFATGNFVGIYLENKLAMGVTLIRIITQTRAKELIQYFRAGGYYVTNVPAKSNSGDVEIIFLPVRRREIKEVIEMVKTFNPNAIYTIADMRTVSYGAVSAENKHSMWHLPAYRQLFHFRRKGK
ncbi:MAG: DUF2179 domain-containing protein [Candidatus Cloacimonetes bacterium]|nr:DUF2179 domain-containing protein [Candidatus Cloacimonadota bacterium]